MNELESLSQLNKMLLAESPQYLAQAAAFPPDAEAQWRLLRSLVNVRAPRPAGGDFLALQDSLLQKITACKGVTAFHSLTPMQKGLYLWREPPRRRTAIYWRPVTVPVLRWRKSTGCAPSHFAASLPENFIFPAGKQRKSQSKP